MLKADLHMHTNYIQPWECNHNPKELIDKLVELGFDVACISEHARLNWLGYQKDFPDALKTYYDFKEYAKSRGLLLIPGVEHKIEGKHVLLLNFKGEISKYRTFEDLKRLKKEHKDVIVAAPHPFFRKKMCLMNLLLENIDLFDAIEHNSFYNRFLNLNKEGVKVANKHNKPVIGNSDAHSLKQLNYTYTLIDAKKDINSVVEAIRSNKVKIVTRPCSIPIFLGVIYNIMLNLKRRKIKNKEFKKYIKLNKDLRKV